MLPATTLNEFINKNHQDVTKIAASLLKRRNQGLLDDIVQQFYYNCVKYNTIGRFDWTVPNAPAAFAVWIKNSIFNTILSEYNRQKRKNGLGFNDVELEDMHTGEKTSVYNRIVPVNFEYGNRACNGDIHVHPSYHASLVKDEVALMELVDTLNGFKEHVKNTDTASDRTKEMLLSYIALSEEGLKPSEIADEFKVTPTYVTTIRKRIKSLFLEYRECELGGELL